MRTAVDIPFLPIHIQQSRTCQSISNLRFLCPHHFPAASTEHEFDRLLELDAYNPVSSICRALYKDLEVYGTLRLTNNSQRFRKVHNHVDNTVSAGELETTPLSFVNRARPELYLCSNFITVALMDMRPISGVCFCSCDTGVTLLSYAKRVKT